MFCRRLDTLSKGLEATAQVEAIWLVACALGVAGVGRNICIFVTGAVFARVLIVLDIAAVALDAAAETVVASGVEESGSGARGRQSRDDESDSELHSGWWYKVKVWVFWDLQWIAVVGVKRGTRRRRGCKVRCLA